MLKIHKYNSATDHTSQQKHNDAKESCCKNTVTMVPQNNNAETQV
jgi:hypothetical protein